MAGNDGLEDIPSFKIEYRSWIDPNSYSDIWSFLNDETLFSQEDMQIFDEDFVICLEKKWWSRLYIPFSQNQIDSQYFIWDKKNDAIDDIYLAYNNKCITGGYNSQSLNKIIFEEDVAHSDSYLLNQIFGWNLNINDVIKELEKVPKKSLSKIELLAYSYDIIGDYKKSTTTRTLICELSVDLCSSKKEVRFYWKILDENKIPIEWVTIELLNDATINTTTDATGSYELVFEYFPFAHLRLKAEKYGYSDGFQTISFNTYKDPSWKKNEERNFSLKSSDINYIVDISNNTYEVIKDAKNYYKFTSKQSVYFVPIDWFVHKDKSRWLGRNFEVHLYEFTKWDNVDNLTNIDTFSPVAGYVWNLMKTFGMPYIQFIDRDTKQEIFISQENPMILQNKIFHMKELYSNYDQIYTAITDKDMQFLVEQSKVLPGYPIDYKFLIENDMLRWPAWWTLDRVKGIWENIGMKVLNVDGLVELPFYSIRK